MDQMHHGMERQTRQPEIGELTQEDLLGTLSHLRFHEGDKEEHIKTLAKAGFDYSIVDDLNRRRDGDHPLSQGQALEKLMDDRNGIHYDFGNEKPDMEKLSEKKFSLEELEHGIEIELPSEGTEHPFRFGIRKAPGTEGYILFGVSPWKNEEIRNYVRYIEPDEEEAKTVVFGRSGKNADWTMPEVSYIQSISRQQFELTVDQHGIMLKDLDSLNGTKVAKHTETAILQKDGENGE